MQNKGKRISDEEWQGHRGGAWKAIKDADYEKAIKILIGRVMRGLRDTI